MYTIKVAKSGRFTIRVPLGGYTVTGHGPYFNDGHATCGGRSIHVTAGALVQAIADLLRAVADRKRGPRGKCSSNVSASDMSPSVEAMPVCRP